MHAPHLPGSRPTWSSFAASACVLLVALATTGCGAGGGSTAAPEPERITQQVDKGEAVAAISALDAANLAVTQCILEQSSGGVAGCEAAATNGVRVAPAADPATDPTGYSLTFTTASGVTYTVVQGTSPSRTCAPVGPGCTGTF